MISNIKQREEIIEKKLKPFCSFKGELNNPLLAPRGVCCFNNFLVVGDTGQNRVIIWKNFLFNQHQKADIVIGQLEQNTTERNGGTFISAATLQYPSGVWTNGEILIVADAWNHRVLIWNKMPQRNGQPADIVIGQKDFNSNQPNVLGIGKKCSAHTLYWPYGIDSNGKELWIADTGNRRVLYFKNIPTSNFEAADEVIGQNSFSERDYDNENAVWPYSVKLSKTGALAITDTQYYRVLVWNHWKDAISKKLPIIIGQPDMQSSGQNQFQLKPSATTLSWCYDACFFKKGIAIADTGNSRIVIRDCIPLENNSIADSLIGQINFNIHGETSLSMKTEINNEMYWPFSVFSNEEELILADTGNHQILFYK